jgi:hypothetical protein
LADDRIRASSHFQTHKETLYVAREEDHCGYRIDRVHCRQTTGRIMKRTQFSIGCIFALTAAVAGLLALWKAPPSWQLGLLEAAIMMAVPAVCGTICLERPGYARAFWLGMAISTTMSEMVFFAMVLPIQNNQWQSTSLFSGTLSSISDNFRFVVSLWSLAPAIGIACLIARRLVRKDSRPEVKLDRGA